MVASVIGRHDIVHTLLEGRANVNATNDVRNQMMLMMMMMMMIVIFINGEDRDVCR